MPAILFASIAVQNSHDADLSHLPLWAIISCLAICFVTLAGMIALLFYTISKG